MNIPDPNFSILALAPLGPVPETGFNGAPVSIDLATLDEAIKTIAPRFDLAVDKALCPEGVLTIEIGSLKDFKPEILVGNVEYLKKLAGALKFINSSEGKGMTAGEAAGRIQSEWPGLPLDYSTTALKPKPKSEKTVDDILSMVAMPDESESGGQGADRPGGLGEQLETILSNLLETVFSDGEFRAYEAAWRGVQTLCKQGPVKEGRGINLSLACTSQETLAADLVTLAEKLSENPPNLIIIDLPMDNTPRGIGLLESITEFADTLLTPAACWIDASFFHISDWGELGKISYIKHHLDDAAYAKWRKLKDEDGAHWLSVLCNRFLARPPYGASNKPRGVYFEERAPLWISPVWALGTLAAQSSVEFGWPSRFTDYTNVLLSDLPLARSVEGRQSSTEISLTEDRLMEFMESGFTPLYGPERKDTAFMPKEATLAGGAMKYQMFVSRILGFLFWCKGNLSFEKGGADTESGLKAAISLYWQKTGHNPPEDLEVKAGEMTEEGATPMYIAMTPPRAVLPGGQRLEFTISW